VCVVSDPQTHAENNDSLPAEMSAGDEHGSAVSPATEFESLHQQPSPHLMPCDDEALASAENENNMNVESENNGNTDRYVEAGDTTDVLTATENLENVADLQLGDMQDSAGYTKTADQMPVEERSSIPELSSGTITDVSETKSTGHHAILSSCSEMVIEVQDHEFTDEELEDTGASGNDHYEPSLQPLSNKSSVEQYRLQQSSESQPIAIEQGQKNQPTTRIIRLNRNFSQHLTYSPDTPECQAKSPGESDRKLLQKPADASKRSGSDASAQRAKSTVVDCGNDNESVMPKQLKVDSTRKQSQASQKLAAQKSVAGASKIPTRGAETPAVKVKSKLSQGSVPLTSCKSVADEYRKVERSQQVLQDEQTDVTAETVKPHGRRGDASAESDSLSKTQLEILELEMRARAIKAMIRAQEQMDQMESVEKKRRSSDVTDLPELGKKQVPQHRMPQSSTSVQQPSSTTSRYHSEFRSLQSVIGRNIIKRAEFVARRQRRMAAQERFRQRQHFVEQHRMSQAALLTSRRTVRLQSDSRPMRYVVASESSPRIVRLPSARFGMSLPFSRRQRQRHLELHRDLASSDNSRGDKRRVLVSSSQRSVRLSSSGRPY